MIHGKRWKTGYITDPWGGCWCVGIALENGCIDANASSTMFFLRPEDADAACDRLNEMEEKDERSSSNALHDA